jgi:hypothetical protein
VEIRMSKTVRSLFSCSLFFSKGKITDSEVINGQDHFINDSMDKIKHAYR